MKYENGNMKPESRRRTAVTVLMALTVLTFSARAATNVALNFTAQQINSNLAHVAAGHVSWDLAYGWGNHALAGYATGTPVYAESDPAWHSGTGALWSAISTAVAPSGYAAVSNAALTAYGWGNHSAAGYLPASGVSALYTAISNAAPANYSAVSNAALSAVQRIVLNGATNTPADGTVDLGTIAAGGSATNIEIFVPNRIRLLSVAPAVADAGTAEANGAYADSGATEDGKPVYTNATCKIRYYTLMHKWQIENLAGTMTYYYQDSAQPVPWAGTWSSWNGSEPLPTVTAATNTVADITEISAVAASAAAAVKAILINGTTNTPVGGTVNLGTIGVLTNISINAASGGIEIYQVVSGQYAEGFTLSGSAYPNVNGDYTPTASGYTNLITGAFFAKTGWNSWSIYEGGTERHWQNYYPVDPWDPESDWSSTTLVFSPLTRRNAWTLTNSLQWVSAPTGSVAAGRSGQYSISADTNRYFYWFSPTAVSGATTGIWLRVEGSAF